MICCHSALHAHTLLLDLEQLVVVANLDNINLNTSSSSSYSSTCNTTSLAMPMHFNVTSTCTTLTMPITTTTTTSTTIIQPQTTLSDYNTTLKNPFDLDCNIERFSSNANHTLQPLAPLIPYKSNTTVFYDQQQQQPPPPPHHAINSNALQSTAIESNCTQSMLDDSDQFKRFIRKLFPLFRHGGHFMATSTFTKTLNGKTIARTP